MCMFKNISFHHLVVVLIEEASYLILDKQICMYDNWLI
jgi:hypothetical protein